MTSQKRFVRRLLTLLICLRLLTDFAACTHAPRFSGSLCATSRALAVAQNSRSHVAAARELRSSAVPDRRVDMGRGSDGEMEVLGCAGLPGGV